MLSEFRDWRRLTDRSHTVVKSKGRPATLDLKYLLEKIILQVSYCNPVQFTKWTIIWAWSTIDYLVLLVRRNTFEEHQVMTVWFPDACSNRAFTRVNVPERHHRLSVGIPSEKLSIVPRQQDPCQLDLIWNWRQKKGTIMFPERAGHIRHKGELEPDSVQNYTGHLVNNSTRW